MRPHRDLGQALICFRQGTEGLAVVFGDGLVRLLQHLARFFPEIVRFMRRWLCVFVCHGPKPNSEAAKRKSPAGSLLQGSLCNS